MDFKTEQSASPLLSLDMTDHLHPDHDYPSTADNLWQCGIDQDVPCFSLCTVNSARVDPGLLLDDPDAFESQEKVSSLQEAIRSGEPLPPVYLLHTVSSSYEYYLFEGMHRFTACHRERAEMLAWLAHIGCCGGPAAMERS
ncbi:MAG TPA: hypothetical protein VFI97_00535 [Arthrobacter sp.]|nr:hypothetical protein [Arthrobacter sp.]